MLVGVAFYSLVIGIFSAFFTSKDTKESLLRKKQTVVDEFCKNLKIESGLAWKIKDSLGYSSGKLAYLWLSSNEDIFTDLSLRLKYEFLGAIHQDLITQCPFFRNRDLSFVVRIVPLLKPMFIKAGEILWQEGDPSTSVYFITDGQISILAHKPKDKISNRKKVVLKGEEGESKAILEAIRNQLYLLNIYESNSYIGEVDIIVKRKRTTFAVATKDTHLMVLSRTEFDSILPQEFPHVYQEVKKLSFQRVEEEISSSKNIDKMIGKFGGFAPGEIQNIPHNNASNHKKKKGKRNEAVFRELVDLEEKTKDRFPIEDILDVDAFPAHDLTTDMVSGDGLEVLVNQLQECRLELAKKQSIEKRIREQIKQKFDANFQGEGLEDAVGKEENRKSKEDITEAQRANYNEIVTLNKQVDDLLVVIRNVKENSQSLESKIDAIMSLVKSQLSP